MNGGNINLGVYDNGSIQGYNSGIQVEYNKDLAGSAATYRSGYTNNNTVTSSHYVRPSISHNVNVAQSVESQKYIIERDGGTQGGTQGGMHFSSSGTSQGGMQFSTSSGGANGVKKYNYYHKKYD